jgi:TP901 family phage tail tape measure protein
MAQDVLVQFRADLDGFRKDVKALQKENLKVGTSAKKGAGEAEKSIGGLQSKLGGGLKTAVAGFGAALAGAFAIQAVVRKAVADITEFEGAIASLAAITGATGKDLDFLRDKAIELGVASGLGASATAKAFELVGSAKPELLKSGEALAEVTKQAIILSQASGDDLTTSASSLTSVLNQFNLTGEESSRVINALAAGSKEGAAAVPSIAQAIEKFGAVAKDSNVTVEQSVGLIETLAEKSITGAEAGTGLRNVILKLTKAGLGFASGQFNINDALEDANKLFSSIQDPIARSAKESQLFGLENVVTAKTLISGRDSVIRYTNAVTGTDTAVKQAAINQGTIAAASERVGAAFEGLILSLDNGTGALSTFIRTGLGGLTSLINLLSGVNESVEDLDKKSFDLIRTNRALADSSETLLNRYKVLADKGIKATADEKEELTRITFKLKNSLGESVTEINKETGALQLNLKAVADVILAKRLEADAESATAVSRLKGVRDAIEENKVLTDIQKQRVDGQRLLAEEERKTFNETTKLTGKALLGARSRLEASVKLVSEQTKQSDLAQKRAKLIKRESELLKELADNEIDVEQALKLISKASEDGGTPDPPTPEQITGFKALNKEIGELKTKILDQIQAGTDYSKNLETFIQKTKQAAQIQKDFNKAIKDGTLATSQEGFEDFKDDQKAREELRKQGLDRTLNSNKVELSTKLDVLAKQRAKIGEDSKLSVAQKQLELNKIALLEDKAREDKKNADDKAEEGRKTREAKALDDQKALNASRIELATTTANAITDVIAAQNARRTEFAIRGLEAQLDEGIIKQEEFEKRRGEILFAQAKKDKDLALFQAIINTAAQVAANVGNPPVAIAAGIAGAAQIAVIGATPLPAFKDGTPFVEQGQNAAGVDTIPAMLNKGERVIDTVTNRANWGILEAIRKNKLEDYIQSEYLIPQLKGQRKESKQNSSLALADNIAAALKSNKFKDGNLLASDKETRKVLRGIQHSIDKANKPSKNKLHY